MRDADELRRKLFGKGAERETIFPAIVTEVNETDFSCTVQRGEVFYYDVRLRGLINPDLKGWAFIPKLESAVLCARIGGSNETFICLFTEIEKAVFQNENINVLIHETAKITAGETTAELTADGIIFNGGGLGGLVTVESLTDKINALIKAFNSHTHTILTGGISTAGTAAKQANDAPVEVPAILSEHPEITRDEIENEKVKH